jgi:hypothetical protein
MFKWFRGSQHAVIFNSNSSGQVLKKFLICLNMILEKKLHDEEKEIKCLLG